MRFLNYLTEQVKYVSIKDLPKWVQQIVKSKRIKRDVEVNINDKVSIGGNWHDANIMEVFLYNKGKVASQKVIGGSSMFDTARERQVKQGFTTQLSTDKMVLVTHTYPKQAVLYVHPNAMIKSLDEPKQDITDQEYLILVATRGLKASYAGGKPREEVARKYRIDFFTVQKQLISKGLLNKNGAINKNGRNALIAKFDSQTIDPYSAARKLKLG